MVSSETARDDLERFYPAARGRAHVVRFAIDLDIPTYLGRRDEMRATYGLPERFYFLPNQFWRHKNHMTVIDALARLKAAGKLDHVMPVALSGLNKDPRSPGHFDALMSAVEQAGVGSHFRYLGLIPYEHVLALAGCCDRLINPSFFEGWSTPIEEAKALGAPLLLSDIPIHREQAPHARFFDPRDPATLAEALLELSERTPETRAPADKLRRDQDTRLDAHAKGFFSAVEEACRRRGRGVQ
jgi:glycosyltransferase involved in cell wall biosynthesis